ncbi:hypothetical protein [Cysteiniphilum marinum]|uniref:hypothetical protein n=1 Tax=Cysteiniphilum marinum TaxID=2774191 RepID=UPI00193A46A8|nr:hypothetical protein [Cysteiniphilum marinum]
MQTINQNNFLEIIFDFEKNANFRDFVDAAIQQISQNQSNKILVMVKNRKWYKSFNKSGFADYAVSVKIPQNTKVALVLENTTNLSTTIKNQICKFSRQVQFIFQRFSFDKIDQKGFICRQNAINWLLS